MKTTRLHCMVWVTVPDRPTARKLAKAVLESRSAACVNIVPGVESHYWWKGKIEKSGELWLVMKTVQARLAELERVVKQEHPYETPEFVVTTLKAGNERYLTWIDESVAGEGAGGKALRGTAGR